MDPAVLEEAKKLLPLCKRLANHSTVPARGDMQDVILKTLEDNPASIPSFIRSMRKNISDRGYCPSINEDGTECAAHPGHEGEHSYTSVTGEKTTWVGS